MAGLVLGVLNGLFVSPGLIRLLTDQHPLEELKEADLHDGLPHIGGHVAYGVVVGLFAAPSGPIQPVADRRACLSDSRTLSLRLGHFP